MNTIYRDVANIEEEYLKNQYHKIVVRDSIMYRINKIDEMYPVNKQELKERQEIEK